MIKKILFLAFSLFSISFAQAQTFNVGGINYEVISGTQVKVIVSTFAGDLVIPETVNNSSTDYTVTLIDNNAFSSQFGLDSVVIPNSVTSIGDNAFNGCFSMSSLDLGDSVISIGDFAFQGCASLTSLVIPNLVETIGASCFQSCDGLLSITIPNSVTSIGDSAFYSCSAVSSISLGDSVTSIGEFAFGMPSSTSNLTTVNCAIATPLTINSNVFSNRVISSCSLNVFASSLSAYQAADVWKDFNPINGTLSTENFSLIEELKIYPNPTQNTLFIEVGNINNAKIEVSDMLRKTQLSQLLSRSVNTINTEKLTTGIYLLRLISDEGTILKKIIKN